MNRLVIAGLGSAGFASLLSAKKTDPKAEITVVDEKEFDLLHNCGLPYALEGILPLDDLKHDINAERMNVKIIREKALKIDVKERKVLTKSNQIEFDALIISTGASALIPPIKGITEFSDKIHLVHNFRDTSKLDKLIEKNKQAVVIGAGAIGLETAFALNKKGMKVKVIEGNESILNKSFDKEMALIAENYLKEKGIEILTGKKVEEIKENSVIAEGKEIKADLIILSTGIKPNTKLAEEAGIELGKKGIKVNEFLETSEKGIFAVGDVIEVPNLINGKKSCVGLANSAYLQGLTAGKNALGTKEKYPGTNFTFVTLLGEIEVASTGFNKEFAESQGIQVVEAKVKGKNKYDWFPDSKELTVKLVVEKKSRKIVGCQAIGKDAYVRVNVVSTAIKAGMTIDELSKVELAYCPPLSEAYDVLLLTAELVKRKLERL
ncbi:MAG: FAD-dependent oxidoreductase [Candidatus Diapherotrites archaeon]